MSKVSGDIALLLVATHPILLRDTIFEILHSIKVKTVGVGPDYLITKAPILTTFHGSVHNRLLFVCCAVHYTSPSLGCAFY